MYLVDTNVLSAAWMDRNSAGLYLSVMTVAEVEDGIAKSHRQGARQKAERLSGWLDALLRLYGSRILPVGLDTARGIGRLADQSRGQGQAPGLADLVIAATARERGYAILTRNVRHFAPLGISALNPFQSRPADFAPGLPG